MNKNSLITFENISADLIEKWQGIADLLASIISVPAALIMKTEDEYMEVLVSSKTDNNNPYHRGDKRKWHGLYCETVIKTQQDLLIANATTDPHWCNNPDIKLGMIAYLGYPINFPDNRPFGTLCVLDKKANSFSPLHSQLLCQFRDTIERDIALFNEHTALVSVVAERQKAESVHTKMLSNIGDVIVIIDGSGIIKYKSPSIEKLFGWKPEELIGKNGLENIHPEDANELQSALTEKLNTPGATITAECRYRCKDGTFKWIEITATNLLNDPDIRGILGNYQDITERKQTDEELKKRNIYIESILANMPIGFAVNTISDGDVKYMNKKFEEIYGWSREVLSNVSIFFEKVFPYPEHRAIMKNRIISDMQSGDPERMKWDNLKIFTSTNEERYVNAINIPLLDQNIMISTVQDMTERKHMEEELRKAQKLESLGLLAGGIAHDFNNLLGGIFGYIDMASEETKETKVTTYLSKAMNTIERARALTGQLLTFAKGGAPIQKIDHLFPFVEETANFALSGANVSCNFDVPQDLWACNFDRNQIGQVIDNLIINAQQAMPVGGIIELSARNVTLSKKEHPILEKGNYVRISIKDTGIGISQEFIAKIFDPFFTTKEKGHGLGLATCYSIINRHGGCIDVVSDPGKGSIFKVYLPASPDSTPATIKSADKTHKGPGTFLIMDDEEAMRDTVGGMLESLGYSVISKKNGKDAVDCFLSETKANRQFAGMVFDLTVPGGMGGKAAIGEIRKVNIEIPVFVASGYADDPIMKNPAEYGFSASICKPFRKSELVEILDKHLKPKK